MFSNLYNWDEMRNYFEENDLKFNRTIKISLLYDISLKKEKIIKLLTDFQFEVKELDDMIRIVKKIDKKREEIGQKIMFNPIQNFTIQNEEKKSPLVLLKETTQNSDEIDKIFLGYLYWIDDYRILFISINKSQLIDTYFFNQFISKISGLNQLWLSYNLMDGLIDFIHNFGIPYKLNEIDVIYLKTFKKKAIIRPDQDKRWTINSEDTESTYNELKTNYGLRIKRISVSITDIGSISISKTSSLLTFDSIDQSFLLDQLINWIYEKAGDYLNIILDFKIQKVKDPLTNITNSLSNYLIFDYTPTVAYSIEQILKSIREITQIKVLSEYIEDDEWDLKIGEKNSKSIVNLFLTPKRIYFTLDDGDSFNSLYPLLETLDNNGELALTLAN